MMREVRYRRELRRLRRERDEAVARLDAAPLHTERDRAALTIKDEEIEFLKMQRLQKLADDLAIPLEPPGSGFQVWTTGYTGKQLLEVAAQKKLQAAITQAKKDNLELRRHWFTGPVAIITAITGLVGALSGFSALMK